MDDLGRRLARGDRQAFAELYDALADRLHHYLVVRLRSREEAAEVLQETFVRLARTRRRLAKVENLAAYVFAVARNEATRFAAKAGRREEVRRQLEAELLFVEAVSDERQQRETAELVTAALAQLSPEQREIVELKTYAGLTLAEIATMTGLPPGTVATRYRTALGRLRELLRRELS
jgi:RNA polymerase sigma-70 factor (ECF subfamily)